MESSPQPWRRIAFALFLLAYFVYFTHDSLRVHFALDEIGNIAHYHRDGVLKLLLSQFTLWHGDYRPMGGLFYEPIFQLAGLNPAPYQVVLLLLLLANVYLVYRFASLLGSGELAAGLAALVVCYHAGLSNLYYNGAFVYDVLCGFFCLAALVWYVRIRSSQSLTHRLLTNTQTAVFLALYLCALNSKEMAVTLPLMLLAYEWHYHRPAAMNRASLLGWLRGPGRVVLLAAALTLVDVYGKLFGPDAMVNAEAYHPVFSLRRMRDFQRVSLATCCSDGARAGVGAASSCCGRSWAGWPGEGTGRVCDFFGSSCW